MWTPQIHIDTPTDSLGFGDLKIAIPFININITLQKLEFSVLLDHNPIYIVHKQKFSAYISFYSIPFFPKVGDQSHEFTRGDTTIKTKFLKYD